MFSIRTPLTRMLPKPVTVPSTPVVIPVPPMPPPRLVARHLPRRRRRAGRRGTKAASRPASRPAGVVRRPRRASGRRHVMAARPPPSRPRRRPLPVDSASVVACPGARVKRRVVKIDPEPEPPRRRPARQVATLQVEGAAIERLQRLAAQPAGLGLQFRHRVRGARWVWKTACSSRRGRPGPASRLPAAVAAWSARLPAKRASRSAS